MERASEAPKQLSVLVFDEEFPLRPDSGKRIRTLGLLTRLRSRFAITFLTHAQPDAANSTVDTHGVRVAWCPSHLPQKTGLSFYARLFLNLFSSRPYSVTSHYSAAFARMASTLAASADLIHCEWTPYAAYALPLGSVPRVVTAHNVESDIWRGYLSCEKNWLKRVYIYLQWKKMCRFEAQVFPHFHGIIAVSEDDAHRIRQLGGRHVGVVENGVDTEYFSPFPEAEEDRLLFCASLDWRPNQDALMFFLTEVFPRIRALIPECTLRVIGRRPPQALRLHAQRTAGVEMLGEVEDVRPHAAASKVVVVPLRVGGGTRLKILEAWSMQRGVVSTTLGASGLPARSGENILLADDPQEFAQATVALLRDEAKRRSLALKGRGVAVAEFDWSRLAEKQARFWSTVHRDYHAGSPRHSSRR